MGRNYTQFYYSLMQSTSELFVGAGKWISNAFCGKKGKRNDIKGWSVGMDWIPSCCNNFAFIIESLRKIELLLHIPKMKPLKTLVIEAAEAKQIEWKF